MDKKNVTHNEISSHKENFKKMDGSGNYYAKQSDPDSERHILACSLTMHMWVLAFDVSIYLYIYMCIFIDHESRNGMTREEKGNRIQIT